MLSVSFDLYGFCSTIDVTVYVTSLDIILFLFLGDIPTISELLSFKRSNGTSVNIAVEVSTGYSKFAAQLLNDDTGARLRNIAHSKRDNPEQINIEILAEWLKGGERRPVSWSALARVLEDIDKGELAAQIKQVKSLN